MIMNAILLLCMYPILAIMYFTLANETKPKKNIVLGTTLPYTSLRNPQVQEICDEFKKALRKTLWILGLVPLPSIFIPYASIAMAVIFNWILVVVFVPYVIYARYRQRLLSLKKNLLHGKESLHNLIACRLIDRKRIPPCRYAFLHMPKQAIRQDSGKRTAGKGHERITHFSGRDKDQYDIGDKENTCRPEVGR